MRHATNRISTLLTSAFIGVLFAVVANSCKPEDVVDSANQTRSTGCRLVARTVTVTYSSPTPPDVRSVNWAYNANNAPVRYTDPQMAGKYAARVDFKYDADGYLTSTTQAYVYIGIVGPIYDTLITNCKYANGKLVREEIVKGGFSNKGTISYEYDQTGQLTKLVDNGTFSGDKKTSVFSAGKLIDYIINYEGSTAEVRPYQLNNGQIIREYARDRRYYTAYQYDEQGRPTKIERVDGERVTQYDTYVYTDGKAYVDAIPLPKGWPTVTRRKFVYEELLPGSPVTPIGLPASQILYQTTRPGSTELFRNRVKEYSHIKNGQGFPVRSEYTSSVYTSFGDVVGTPSRVTETYTYEGCP